MNFEFLEEIKGYLDRDQIDQVKHLVDETLKTQVFQLYLAGQLERKTVKPESQAKPKDKPLPKQAPKAAVSALELHMPEKQQPQASAFELVKNQAEKGREAITVQYELVQKKRKRELEALVSQTSSKDIESATKPIVMNREIDYKRLKKEIRTHLKSKYKKDLCREMGLQKKTLDDIISCKEPMTLRTKTLEKLIDFFGNDILVLEGNAC